MDFRTASRDEPDINLIPFIDILLVVVIFLVMTTTYSQFTELSINLPQAQANAPKDKPQSVTVAVGRDGRYMVNDQVLPSTQVAALTQALKVAAGSQANTIVVINADAAASHQSVIAVMDAARRAGLGQLAFATQQPNNAR
ncbi:ExbD Biopolymer transport protein [Burkholderiaceae bacterium]|jgi:biopolymer transport protein ExbD